MDDSYPINLPALPDNAFSLKIHSGGFSDQSDLSYRLIDGLNLSKISARQSLLNGSLIRNCEFKDCDLSRCDLEAVRLESCTLYNTRLDTADIRSSTFSRVVFNRCSFNEAFVDDCTFIECEFINCAMDSMIITHSTYKNCAHISCSFVSSTVLLNQYRHCKFSELTLGNNTFLLHVIDKCDFYKCKINIDAVGYIYGITQSNLENVGYVFLGNDENIQGSIDIIPRLVEEFKRRQWFFGYSILRLNFRLASPLLAIREMLAYFVNLYNLSMPIKRDEVLFFELILEEMHREDSLPLFNVIEIVDVLNNLPHEDDAPRLGIMNLINQLKTRLFLSLAT